MTEEKPSCNNCVHYRPARDICELGLAGNIISSGEWSYKILRELPSCKYHEYHPREQRYRKRQQQLEKLKPR